MRKTLIDAQKIVIKVGTSTLTHKTGRMNLNIAQLLSMVICDIANSGRQPILVSSGSVALGVGKLRITPYPTDVQVKQAAAAVGQCELMSMYDRFFSAYGNTIAQVLLTKDVIDDELRKENAKTTFDKLLRMGIIPIVNENDTVSSQEIKFSDNDMLAAYVALITGAEAVIILSDIDGLFDKNPALPGATLITEVPSITPDVESFAVSAGSKRGTGGMHTKLSAAKLLTQNGISMVIANGNNPLNVLNILKGEDIGTFFKAEEARL